MRTPGTADNEFFDLMYDLAEDRLPLEKAARLEELLLADPARRRQYVDFLVVVSGLHRAHGAGLGEKSRGQGAFAPSVAEGSRFQAQGSIAGGMGQGTEDAGIPPSVNPPSPFPLPPSVPSYPSHSSLSSLLSLDTPLGSFLFSYGVSAVFVGILILSFSLMSANHPKAKNIAGGGPSPSEIATPERVPEPEIILVGQITGMVDCTFSDDHFAPAHNGVALGAKYMLASGLMEITYKTGAKVILQGPCTYTAESTAGGFLSLGKLTARVEKKAEAANLPSPSGRGAGGEGSAESPDQSALTLALSGHHEVVEAREPGASPIPLPPSPLFAVRTPTAVVTDLGTEFGVEVVERGGTSSFVYRGSVSVAALNKDGRPCGDAIMLQENQSAQVGIAPRRRTGGRASRSRVAWTFRPRR